MAIVLTNGTYFIAHNKTGATIKVTDIEMAQDFFSVENAIKQKKKAPGKCAGFYYIDTDMENNNVEVVVDEHKNTKPKKKEERKSFSAFERLEVYRKTEGHCYLCGDFVDFDSFEMEHRLPLSKGGTNDLSNIFCSCHTCNTIKRDIYPTDLLEQVTKIFLYQMNMKHGNKLMWRIVHRVLCRMI